MLSVLPSSSDWTINPKPTLNQDRSHRRFGLTRRHIASSAMLRSSEEQGGFSLFHSKREASAPPSPLLPSFKSRRSKRENRIYSSSAVTSPSGSISAFHSSPLLNSSALPVPEDLGIGPSRLTSAYDSNPILGDDDELHDPSFVRHNWEMMAGFNDNHGEASYAQRRPSQRRHPSSPSSTPLLDSCRSTSRPNSRAGPGNFVSSNAFSGLSAYARPRSEGQNHFNAGLGLEVEGSILGQDDDLLLASSSDESDDDAYVEQFASNRMIRRAESGRRLLPRHADSPLASTTDQHSPFTAKPWVDGSTTPLELVVASDNVDRSTVSDRDKAVDEDANKDEPWRSTCDSPQSAVQSRINHAGSEFGKPRAQAQDQYCHHRAEPSPDRAVTGPDPLGHSTLNADQSDNGKGHRVIQPQPVASGSRTDEGKQVQRQPNDGVQHRGIPRAENPQTHASAGEASPTMVPIMLSNTLSGKSSPGKEISRPTPNSPTPVNKSCTESPSSEALLLLLPSPAHRDSSQSQGHGVLPSSPRHLAYYLPSSSTSTLKLPAPIDLRADTGPCAYTRIASDRHAPAQLLPALEHGTDKITSFALLRGRTWPPFNALGSSARVQRSLSLPLRLSHATLGTRQATFGPLRSNLSSIVTPEQLLPTSSMGSHHQKKAYESPASHRSSHGTVSMGGSQSGSRNSSLAAPPMNDWRDGFTGLVDLDKQMRELAMAENQGCSPEDKDYLRFTRSSIDHGAAASRSANHRRKSSTDARTAHRFVGASKFQQQVSGLVHAATKGPASSRDSDRSMHEPRSASSSFSSIAPADPSLLMSPPKRIDSGAPTESSISSPATQSISSGNSISTAASSHLSPELGSHASSKSQSIGSFSLLSKRKASARAGNVGIYDTLGTVQLATIPSASSPFGNYRLTNGDDSLLPGWSYADRRTNAWVRQEEEGTDPLTPTPQQQINPMSFNEDLLTPNSAAAATWTDPEAPGYFPAGLAEKISPVRDIKKARRRRKIGSSGAASAMLPPRSEQITPGHINCSPVGSLDSTSPTNTTSHLLEEDETPTRDRSFSQASSLLSKGTSSSKVFVPNQPELAYVNTPHTDSASYTLRRSAQSLVLGMRFKMLRAKRKIHTSGREAAAALSDDKRSDEISPESVRI